MGRRMRPEPGREHWLRAAKMLPDATHAQLQAMAETLLQYDHGRLPLPLMREMDRLSRP